MSSRETSRQSADEAREQGKRSREQPQELAELHQHVGNAAIARLLQRAPKDRPASTDAPGAHAGGKHGKSEAKPKVADIHARVIKADIDDGKTRITIGSGPDQGVKVGMSGSLVRESGTEYADFTVETAGGRVSTAHVQAIPDQINADPNVVIKASSFAGESQEGKEF